MDTNLPAYGRVSRKKLTLDTGIGLLNSITCTIDTSHRIIPKLRRHDQFEDMTVGTVHNLKMVEIYPIYALTIDPNLYDSHGFRLKNKEYSKEI